MLALLAIVVLAPLLYLPGYCITYALLGPAKPADLLERHYERVIVGALLNGWLAFTLAELGIFSAWLHLLLVLAICAAAFAVAYRRGTLRLPQAPLRIVAYPVRIGDRTIGRQGGTQAPRRMLAMSPRHWLATHWEVAGFIAGGALFVLLVGRPFEVVLGARDAGTYANTGMAIARSGGIVQYDEVLRQIAADQASADVGLRAAAEQAETNLLGVQPRTRFIATRLRMAGFLVDEGDLALGRVVPQGFHLYPAWIGLLASLLGTQGGLLATGLLGFLGVWSVAMLGRRLAGPWVGLLGGLFLALNGVQVWFSRYSTSEACAQFLCFAGFYAFAVMQEPGTKNREPVVADGSWFLALGSRSGFAALVAGLAFGQVALARIDFLLLLPPLFGYLLYIWLTRRWSRLHTLLSAGLGAMLLHAVLHIAFIARAYFFDTLFARLQDVSAIVATLSLPFLTPALQEIYRTTTRSALLSPARLPAEIGLMIAGCIALYLLRRNSGTLLRIERAVLRRQRALLNVSALSIVLLGIYGYFIRPQIITAQTLTALPGCVSPAQLRQPSGPCLALQGYIGAPIVPARYPNLVAYWFTTLPEQLVGADVPPRVSDSMLLDDKAGEIGIAQASMVRVGWYLSPLGVILGVVGFALWWRRGMNRMSWIFFAVSLIVAIFFIRLSYGSESQTYIYILRRYVPLVYPALSLGMAYAIVALAASGRAGERASGRVEEELSPRYPFTPSPHHRWRQGVAVVLTLALLGFFAATNRPLYNHVEYAGALDQLSALVDRYGFGSNDVLLFRGEGRDTPDLVVTPLKYSYGLDALAIRSDDPGKYAEDLARYVRRWQAQGRQVYLVLGPNGALELPGLRPQRLGSFALHLPEFQQLRDQKPRGLQNFVFDFVVYRLGLSTGAPESAVVAVDDFAAQVRGFYHPEQIDGQALAWTDGSALLRLPWPRDGKPHTLTINLSPGATRPAGLGPAQACIAYRPESGFALEDLPFADEQCVTLNGTTMAGYRFTIDPRGQPTPATGAYLLRIASSAWVPAKADPAQVDQRALGVQFGGAEIEN